MSNNYIDLESKLELSLREFNNNPIGSAERDGLIESVRDNVKQMIEILWNESRYSALERILLKVESILGNEYFWRKWLVHSVYMQDTRYEECCELYEKFLPLAGIDDNTKSSLIDVDPVILGNLCVSYLLTGKNSAAESLIKDIELEESNRNTDNDDNRMGKTTTHSCIVNLIIGNLYCVKLNYSFGLIRIFRALEPIELLLNNQTWFICKQGILSLLDNHCKSMIFVRDDLFDQIVNFLLECEKYGFLIETTDRFEISQELLDKLSLYERSTLLGRNSVTYEARYLRSLVLNVLHD